jgi:membrane-bound lytic murein transglycosylase MltF
MRMKRKKIFLVLMSLGVVVLIVLFISAYQKQTRQPPVLQSPESSMLNGSSPVIDLPVVSSDQPRQDDVHVSLKPTWKKVRPGAGHPHPESMDIDTAILPVDGEGLITWERTAWTGDLDGMKKRRVIRALVPYSGTFYFLDNGRKRGLIYDALMEYEKFLNAGKTSSPLSTHIVVIPTPRDRLIPYLLDGYGDIAAGNLTITDQRRELVDFTDPTLKDVDEILVTGTQVPIVHSIFELSGKEVAVRKSSSYYESLVKLNRTLKSLGKKPVILVLVDEYLEDEDMLELVNAGILPRMVIDSHKGKFWAEIFPDIRILPNIKLRTGGEIAWAIRKNSPQLKKNINRFVKTIKKGSLTGNILFRRYLQNTRYVDDIASKKARDRYRETIALFKKYGKKYDFPYLLLTALAYQESGLDQSKRSRAGAVGIMQVMPATARDRNVHIDHIEKLENNIHAGTRYLRFMADRYFSDPDLTPLNRDLLTIASYNAGPTRIQRLRKEAARRGLDPDVWFNNVEVVAAARIGRETVQYVRNIFKYYIAYDYIAKKARIKKAAKETWSSKRKDNVSVR